MLIVETKKVKAYTYILIARVKFNLPLIESRQVPGYKPPLKSIPSNLKPEPHPALFSYTSSRITASQLNAV